MYGILTGKNDLLVNVIFILAGCLLIPFLIRKTELIVWGIILFAPISLGLILPFLELKMTFPSEMFSGIALIVFGVKVMGGMAIDRQLLKHPLTWLLTIDLMWSVVSAFQSDMSQVAFKRVAMKLLFMAVYFLIFANYMKSDGRRKRLFVLYGVGALYPIYHAIMVHSRTNFVQASSFNISQPYFADHTVYGACLAFVIPFFCIYAWKSRKEENGLASIGYWLILIVLIIAEVLSYSRASWISLIVALGFYGLTKLRVKIGHIIGFLVIAVVLLAANFETIYGSLRENETKNGDDIATHISSVTNLQNDASNLERVNRWVCAYRMFEEQPVFGFGPGTYQFVYDEFQTAEFMTRISTHKGNRGNAHSEYFTYLSETGFPGLIIFLCWMFYTIYLALKLLYSNLEKQDRKIVYAAILGLITFFAHGLFNTFSDYEKMGILVFGSMAILTILDIQYHRKNSEASKENSEVSRA